VSDRSAVLPQYLFPKQALTAFAGFVASRERGWVTTGIIRRFVARYQVDMNEAVNPDIASYATFNDFFTRPLREDARPLADAPYVSPVDGAISQFGEILLDQVFQAKGHSYSTRTLVGGDPLLAAHFDHGSFATLYLSPRDYHRIHMPCDGVLRRMIYIPGDLFSVNPVTARGVPSLFARNERTVCVFDGPRAVRAGAGRRDHRRQHADGMARRDQSAARQGGAAVGLPRRADLGDTPEAGRGNGPFPAGLHRRHAVSQRAAAVQPRVGARPRDTAGRGHGGLRLGRGRKAQPA
jgi:phosphatidylserine decarboxylase